MFWTRIRVIKASTGVVRDTYIKFCGRSEVSVQDLILQINHCWVDFKTTNLSKGGDRNFPYLKKKKKVCSNMVSFSFGQDMVDNLRFFSYLSWQQPPHTKYIMVDNS